MLSLKQKLNLLIEVLGPLDHVRSNEYFFFCPKHNHRKAKLSVNLETDKWQCWICGWNSKKQGLIRLFVTSPNVRQSKEFREYVEDFSGEKENLEEKVYTIPKLPPEFRTLTKEYDSIEYKKCLDYLHKREVSLEDCFKYKLGFCETGVYAGRIIVPSFDELGNLNFFMGRSYTEYRYKFKVDNFSKDIIWNDYLLDWKRPITLTEGPFDAIKINNNVVALQGCNVDIHSKLFNKILASEVDVYFALDSDAIQTQLRCIERFVKFGIVCYFIDLTGFKDASEMPREIFKDRYDKAVKVDNTLSLTALKIKYSLGVK